MKTVCCVDRWLKYIQVYFFTFFTSDPERRIQSLVQAVFFLYLLA